MKLFEDVEDDGQEVRIESEDSGKDTGSRLEEDAREKLSSAGEKSVTLDDIQEQNERIIELLEQMNEEDGETQEEGDYSGVL